MELVVELLRMGGGYVLAGAFCWLWLQERSDRKESEKREREAQSARITDIKSSVDNVTTPLSYLSKVVDLINQKLEDFREGKRR